VQDRQGWRKQGGGESRERAGGRPCYGGGISRATLFLVLVLGLLPLAASQCTSGVCDAKLTFPSTPVAGQNTELVVKWKLQYDFQAGDYVDVRSQGHWAHRHMFLLRQLHPDHQNG